MDVADSVTSGLGMEVTVADAVGELIKVLEADMRGVPIEPSDPGVAEVHEFMKLEDRDTPTNRAMSFINSLRSICHSDPKVFYRS
jgi:hypothetical protein